jgi:hypothetical protein
LAAAVVGGVVGGASAIIGGAVKGHIDWTDVAIGTVAGAATAAAFDTCGLCAGAVDGFVTDAATQFVHNGSVNVYESLVAGGIGGVAGGLGDAIGNSLGAKAFTDSVGIVTGSIDPVFGFNYSLARQSALFSGSSPTKFLFASRLRSASTC